MGQKESKSSSSGSVSSKYQVKTKTKSSSGQNGKDVSKSSELNPSPASLPTETTTTESPTTKPSSKEVSASKSREDSKTSLESFYNKYKDATEDAILAEGVESFCEDLGVDPTDFIVLVLAWKFQASEMCKFTKEEFINGCQKLKAMDAKELKQRFPDLIKETKESEKSFKDLYQFTFTFGLDHGSGQRVLPTEMALQLWELLFTHKKYPLLPRWLDFLQSSGVKNITRDTWNMFLPFLQTMKDNLDNYDESEAWPTLFDDFVEFETEKK